MENALDLRCRKWFFRYCKAYIKGTLDLSGDTQTTSTSNPSLEPMNAIVSSSKGKEQ